MLHTRLSVCFYAFLINLILKCLQICPSSQFSIKDLTANEILPGSLLCILTGHEGRTQDWPLPLAPHWSEPSLTELPLDRQKKEKKKELSNENHDHNDHVDFL